MELLVSLIRKHLLYIKINPLTLNPIKLRANSGITGLAKYKDGYVGVCFRFPHLLYFNKNFKLEDHWHVPNMKLGHSIIPFNGKYYIAASGNDKIIEIDLEKKEFSDFYKIDPEIPSSKETDTVHLNSVTVFQNQICFSQFGDLGLENTKNKGSIQTVKGKILFSGLFHPHTTLGYKNSLFFCDSMNATIRQDNQELKIPGYARGLAINDKYLVVGISAARKKSERTGEKIKEFKYPGQQAPQPSILIFERAEKLADYKLIKEINLDGYTNEIYDILIL